MVVKVDLPLLGDGLIEDKPTIVVPVTEELVDLGSTSSKQGIEKQLGSTDEVHVLLA